MKLTDEEFREIMERPAIRRANNIDHKAEAPIPQRLVCHEPLAQAQGEDERPGRFVVRFESRRKRLLDPDNVCPKYILDGLRYAGLIPNDRPEDINLQITQTKVGSKEEEETIVTIIAP